HELTHVVQQARSVLGQSLIQRRGLGEPDPGVGGKLTLEEARVAAERTRRVMDAGVAPPPALEPHGVCGPNMTTAVGQAVENTHNAFRLWSATPAIQHSACRSLRDSRTGLSAWDIYALHPPQIDSLNAQFTPQCAQSPPDPGIRCARSVEIFPGCHY